MTITFKSKYSAGVSSVEEAVRGVLNATKVGEGSYVFLLETPFQRDVETTIRIQATEHGTRVTLSCEPLPTVPYFSWALGPFGRMALRRHLRWETARLRAELEGKPEPRRPGWGFLAPPARFSPEQGVVLATVAALSLVAGLGGSLFSQNVDFVANAFGASNSDLGISLAVTRAGVLVSLVASALADRRGRRKLLLASVIGMCVFNAASAAAPDIFSFTAAQTLVRGFVSAALVIAGVMAVEESPHGARAYSVAMLTLASGAGAALGTVLLPIGDLAPQAWRVSFILSAAAVAFVPGFARRLKETDRFLALASRTTKLGRFRQVVNRSYAGRFWIMVAAGFLLALASSPWFQFGNRFLGDERGFSGLEITWFRAATQALPGLLGVVLGGRLAESYGRRRASVITLTVATVVIAAFFLSDGPLLWITSAIGFSFEAAASIALASFGIELFPTEIRGTANALLLVAAVAGSAVGLVAAGFLAAPMGSLGAALAVLGLPGLAAVVLIPKLPEAAGLTLEQISPSEI